MRWQCFEVVHLFNVAVTDFTPGFVTLPNEAGIAGGLVSLSRVFEWRIPAPTIDTGDPHAALQQVHGGVVPHAAPIRDVIILAIAFAGCSVHHHDIERLKCIFNTRELCFDIVGRNHVAVGFVSEVELDAVVKAPFKRNLIDGDGAFAAIHCGREVIGRVEVCAIVRAEFDGFDRPTFGVGQLRCGESREASHHSLNASLMIDIGNLRLHARWVRNDFSFKVNRKINKASCHGWPPRVSSTAAESVAE